MRRLLDGLITAVALIFFIPTILVLISWNAIPGDGLYPLKTGLEDVTLLILSGTPFVPKASIKFTDRRLSEATTLLSRKGSTVGYELLVAEAQQTQTYIVQKNDVTDSAAFVQNIDAYQKQIAQTKAQVAANAQIPITPTATTIPATSSPSTPFPTSQAVTAPLPQTTENPAGQQIVVTKPETIIIKQETPQEVIQNLDETQAKLEKIKQDLQKSQENQGKGQEQNQGKGQNQ